jgi:hypothetical protein
MKRSGKHVEFGPCQCNRETEEWELIRSGVAAPTDVLAQYRCETCGTEVE